MPYDCAPSIIRLLPTNQPRRKTETEFFHPHAGFLGHVKMPELMHEYEQAKDDYENDNGNKHILKPRITNFTNYTNLLFENRELRILSILSIRSFIQHSFNNHTVFIKHGNNSKFEIIGL